jgi:hypothetical protein
MSTLAWITIALGIFAGLELIALIVADVSKTAAKQALERDSRGFKATVDKHLGTIDTLRTKLLRERAKAWLIDQWDEQKALAVETSEIDIDEIIEIASLRHCSDTWRPYISYRREPQPGLSEVEVHVQRRYILQTIETLQNRRVPKIVEDPVVQNDITINLTVGEADSAAAIAEKVTKALKDAKR